jgi:NAD(P)-dependent dehydrogenase (short-subunit alcohol dehydrogenase family)
MAPARIALVTGAGSGIGQAVSIGLLQDGWDVALVGRRATALEETAALAAGAPGRAVTIPADVTQVDDVRRAFGLVRETWGRLDLLFNNAGVSAPAVPLEDLTLAQWRTVVDINLTGVFLCTQEAVRLMKAQSPRGGRIINNGSISAHVPRPNSAAYTATKHAVTGLTRATALDGRAFDIACGQIDIGNAATPMTARMAKGVPQPDGSTRVEPTMDSSNVGKTILYMAELDADANALFVVVKASKMPFEGRG